MKQLKTTTKSRRKAEPAKLYKIGGEGELREVLWLIGQGDYKSVDDYIYKTSLSLYGPKKKKAS